MTDEEQLTAIVATELDRLERMKHIGEWGTAGPDVHVEPVEAPPIAHPAFVDGWWSHAKQMKACPGRIGGVIHPYATVVHTTDMLPEELQALIAAWLERAGDGSCATFLIGRTEADGVMQFCPITRNANHAGGPGHGVFDHAHATGIHPNLVTTGIELHCAGGVQRVGGLWRLVEGGKAHGTPLPDCDVIPDPRRPGRGWHVVTDYQRARLAALLHDIDQVQSPAPAGLRARSTGETPPSWAAYKTARVVTHALLDPEHRADPWPPTCGWLRDEP